MPKKRFSPPERSNASAVCYMEMEHPGGKLFGVGINTNLSNGMGTGILGVQGTYVSPSSPNSIAAMPMLPSARSARQSRRCDSR